MSRRKLLKTGCAAATSFAAPVIIPSSALGDANMLPPSERVTLGHIGVGTRGRSLFAASQSGKGIQSLAVADCFKNRRESFAARIKGRAYADFRELLERDDIDGVIIATPDHWHVPIALMAARAGKDAYVEKPLGLTLEQSVTCQKVFTATKRIFQYGTQQREAIHQQFGRELVRSGKLGELKAIEVRAPNGGIGGTTAESPVPAGFDYDMWLGPAPKVPYTVDRCKPQGTYWIYDQSIGYLGGWGAHPLDILVWCYGGDQSGPYTVEGTGVVPTEGLYDAVYDWDMTLRMADGVKITFRPGTDSTKFIGTQARLELTRNSIRAFPTELLSEEMPSNSHGQSNVRHVQAFVDSIRSRQPPTSPIDDAVRSDVMSHLCNIAVRTGEKITWDPARQQIIGGSTRAQSMASRPMREPWTL
ncbi:MAG: Gfo/Idh/MocA family oxidoreductase [Fuerstiella sp.]|nr:Gfo/Idh/MocA family oxidoreductase [Fuerstiella sp.]MCP4506804.1 Gfo/Idh/MocA family oxidoreductase [Fuerstiella sp.]MCP4783729.1 Gfo/Idh/MocA family oxidoreductase [Fuerstiella sp.]MCP4857036.1 Gfo/Idh/MocA family oxidoreductase [Fuerstiella sp.]